MYATTFDPKDVRAWSGTVHYIAKSLEGAGLDVEYLGDLQRRRLFINKAINKLVDLASPGTLYPVDRTLSMAERMATEIREHLVDSKCDAILSPGSIPLALLRTTRPKVFYTDATFAGILEMYPEYRKYPKRYIKEGHELEQAALSNCDLAIYASEWAAASARDNYDVDGKKLRVVPFGSNFSWDPTDDEVQRMIEQRRKGVCELLFLGVSWDRKGGDKALRTTKILHERGVRVRLRVVGCEPPKGELPAFVEVHPFISKHTVTGQRKLSAIIGSSHFLLLPSLAECFGIVLSEAASFGVPSLANAIGGITTAVHEGRNGRLFGPKASAEQWADVIQELVSDRSAYERFAFAARKEYRQRLNWDVSGHTIRELIDQLI